MLKLIFIEIKKILSKRSIYVVFLLMLLFCILNNILYKLDYDNDGNYKYLEVDSLKEEENTLKEEIKKYSKDNSNEVTMYITVLTKLDLINLKKQYLYNSWQYNKINDYLYNPLYMVNYYSYVEDNNKELVKVKLEYQNILDKFKNDDWKYFLNLEKSSLNNEINSLKEAINITTKKEDLLELKEKLSNLENDLKLLNYRLDNNIKEDGSYLNKALNEYQINYVNVSNYKDRERTRKEEVIYLENLSNMKINQYILENKININKENNLSNQLKTITEDYELFLVILVLMIASGIIVDEFRDGTIKLLLIKPYSRGKILLSKYLAFILILVSSITFLILIQLIIGGVIFGFTSLKVPVVVYDLNKLKLVEYSVIHYMFIRILARLPFFILMGVLAMLMGVISCNVIVSIMIPMMMYMFSPAIYSLVLRKKLEFMKYFISMNFNLENYLFGNITEVSGINLEFSCIVLMCYFILLVIFTYILFKRKNIKNI